MKLVPKKKIPHFSAVELGEDGAVIILENGQKVYFTADQVTQIWGMLTLAVDCACFGSLSGKIRRLGLWQVMQNALDGVRTIRDEGKQRELPNVR